MSRDQRVSDNWALLFAAELAKGERPLAVVFCLVPEFLEATERQYGFMLRGLRELEQTLSRHHIPFFLLLGKPEEEIVTFAKQVNAGAVVTDFDPLRIKQTWKTAAAKHLPCALFEVDAHNVVPCFVASPKLEFGAYTIRPKIHKQLRAFLTEFPKLPPQKIAWPHTYKPVDWEAVTSVLRIDRTVPEVTQFVPGEAAAQRALAAFCEERLPSYDAARNDPNADGQSGFSPYLHFGQLSAQRVALAASESAANSMNKAAFLEELIVRRELADNFCFYQPHYDSVAGFPNWARQTIDEHRKDKREYLYTLREFERAETHDALWNAAEREMVRTGKMHGYLRMYWAKKIFEWTKTPEEAMKIAIYLNDRYELDGRDPNGYTGIAWSVGGAHDRAWFPRAVFGKIRYMNANGCKKKFDTEAYIARYS